MRQHRTRVFEDVEQAFRKLVRANSRRQVQRCHHQPESLTAVLFKFLLQKLLNLSFALSQWQQP